LSGGNILFKSFKERMEKEIKYFNQYNFSVISFSKRNFIMFGFGDK
jgi:actin-related protein